MRLIHDNCVTVLRDLKSNSIDSIVTDPPAGISFMNKSFDKFKDRGHFIEEMKVIFSDCLRVLKPGAHAFVWALPRTSHWTATALENSGFEIRDVVTHLFGSGFPKSLNLGDGWGTGLKPASEHWLLCRKPISEKTIAQNVMKWGTGGINIANSRIEITEDDQNILDAAVKRMTGNKSLGWVNSSPNGQQPVSAKGRFPSNLILDEESAELLDEQSSACASRFFYCAKPSQSERNAGLEDRETQKVNDGRETEIDNPFQRGETQRKNIHPTVKPFKLMSYLINMITPANGIVLDPFMGSGSTGIAALKSGFDFIGIEKEKEYFDIAEKRINDTSRCEGCEKRINHLCINKMAALEERQFKKWAASLD